MGERLRHTVILTTATGAKVENLATLVYSSKRQDLISIAENTNKRCIVLKYVFILR